MSTKGKTTIELRDLIDYYSFPLMSGNVLSDEETRQARGAMQHLKEVNIALVSDIDELNTNLTIYRRKYHDLHEAVYKSRTVKSIRKKAAKIKADEYHE